MTRKRSFVVGRSRRKCTTMYILQVAQGPIRGPWLLQAVVLN
jgi:hypothetical protein